MLPTCVYVWKDLKACLDECYSLGTRSIVLDGTEENTCRICARKFVQITVRLFKHFTAIFEFEGTRGETLHQFNLHKSSLSSRFSILMFAKWECIVWNDSRNKILPSFLLCALILMMPYEVRLGMGENLAPGDEDTDIMDNFRDQLSPCIAKTANRWRSVHRALKPFINASRNWCSNFSCWPNLIIFKWSPRGPMDRPRKTRSICPPIIVVFIAYSSFRGVCIVFSGAKWLIAKCSEKPDSWLFFFCFHFSSVAATAVLKISARAEDALNFILKVCVRPKSELFGKFSKTLQNAFYVE